MGSLGARTLRYMLFWFMRWAQTVQFMSYGGTFFCVPLRPSYGLCVETKRCARQEWHREKQPIEIYQKITEIDI